MSRQIKLYELSEETRELIEELTNIKLTLIEALQQAGKLNSCYAGVKQLEKRVEELERHVLSRQEEIGEKFV